jgi:predicted phosphate transport protein (TIGR00153 family)
MNFSTLMGKVVAPSPFVILHEHMQCVLRTVAELVVFLESVQADDWDRAQASQEKIVDYEKEADKLKLHLRKQLSNRLLMPIARADLLDLIAVQDKIANRCKDIAGLMRGRKLSFPNKLDKSLADFASVCVDATSAALDAINSTHDLFRSGFTAQQAKEVEQKIVEIERLERRSDRLQVKLRSRLYKLEKGLSPVDVMFMYQVMVWMGDIADRTETVSHRLLLISRS